ncbi:hypothetical protein E8D34_14980 [Nocardioides sp. GY 10113]|uniref:hypothetical protein n=1 Tax=Nocardioides sp. GY 10113 TaxID=2569761 RepID=UPI0010A7B058|nr:hypothetical protein [Nocardioides sp. GY 10113]TIC83865.1 hypothetical protein E8D34_14980 [Nocardioides sp. GY 10113]
MGWFGNKRAAVINKETPVSAQMILRFKFAPSGPVIFTLDQGARGRTWYSGYTKLLLVEDPRTLETASMEAIFEWMMPQAWAVVQDQVPSATKTQMQVQLDGETGDFVCVGPVTFLESEWSTSKARLLRLAQGD